MCLNKKGQCYTRFSILFFNVKPLVIDLDSFYKAGSNGVRPKSVRSFIRRRAAVNFPEAKISRSLV